LEKTEVTVQGHKYRPYKKGDSEEVFAGRASRP